MTNRHDALRRLLDSNPGAADQAANELLERPDWATGPPPDELVRALLRAGMSHDAESAVFELGRRWERAPLSRSLMTALQREQDPAARTCAAWLLKNLASQAVWSDMAVMALSEGERMQTRRWLLEGLDRLAFVGDVGWDELRDLVHALRQDKEPRIRDGVVGILMSLNDGGEKASILLDMLGDSDSGVLDSALNALSHDRLRPRDAYLARLRELSRHLDPRVSLAARALLERFENQTGTGDTGSEPA